MPSLLQIHFTFPAEMMGPALTAAALPLAESITREPGFISKIWKRVLAMGASAVQFKVFDVNEPLSRITKGIS